MYCVIVELNVFVHYSCFLVNEVLFYFYKLVRNGETFTRTRTNRVINGRLTNCDSGKKVSSCFTQETVTI
jgi:hypothetical protein